jgi:hypothetical protein
MTRIFLAALGVALLGATSAPPYSIQAIRLADSPGDAVAEMVIGAPKDEKVDTVYALWLIRGGGHNILFDSGFHHAHWDHMGGLDLFSKAAVWIQAEEFRYYAGPAWQPGGDHGGIDPARTWCSWCG